MSATRMFPTVPHPADEDADDSFKEGKGDGYQKYRMIAGKLERLFGLGENAALRRKLYIRIQKCAIEHGPDCYELVKACVTSAQVADKPDRYFCTSVTSELKAQGYWAPPVDF